MQASMDGVFQALASASRRQILDIVKNNPGCSVNAVRERFDQSLNAFKYKLEEAC